MQMTTWLAVAFAVGCGGNAVDPAGDAPAALRTPDGLEYSAETLVMESFPVQLNTRVHVTNSSSSARTLTFPDGCVVLVRAYRAGSSKPVWDQGNSVGCTMALVGVNLAPGETRTLESRTGAAEILGDSLPDGRYTLEAYLRPSTGTVTVDAGVADLAVPR